MIHHSYFAEIDGHIAILMTIEGESDKEITENFNGKIYPLMIKNHGEGTIYDVTTIRVNDTIRLFHNYMPFINIKEGKRKDWSMESIY